MERLTQPEEDALRALWRTGPGFVKDAEPVVSAGGAGVCGGVPGRADAGAAAGRGTGYAGSYLGALRLARGGYGGGCAGGFRPRLASAGLVAL
nr:hypothetical protein [Tanacetum cinerariifolium]